MGFEPPTVWKKLYKGLTIIFLTTSANYTCGCIANWAMLFVLVYLCSYQAGSRKMITKCAKDILRNATNCEIMLIEVANVR